MLSLCSAGTAWSRHWTFAALPWLQATRMQKKIHMTAGDIRQRTVLGCTGKEVRMDQWGGYFTDPYLNGVFLGVKLPTDPVTIGIRSLPVRDIQVELLRGKSWSPRGKSWSPQVLNQHTELEHTSVATFTNAISRDSFHSWRTRDCRTGVL